MKTYTWRVERLECLPVTEVVVTAHWRVTGTEDAHSANRAGATGLTPPAGAPITTFAELTERIVIGWVKAQLGVEGVANIEADLAAQLEALATPPVVVRPLPWAE